MSLSIAHLACIALGGALGAVGRYLAVAAVTATVGARFPWGTLLVNAAGSLLLGCAFVLIMEKWGGAPAWRSLVMVGFLGAFTTFSTYALEGFFLLTESRWTEALIYLLGSVILCLLGVAAGISATRWFLSISA